MADTHEEQLLTGLLSDVAREDAPLDAAHLEARVLASVTARSKPRDGGLWRWMAVPVAAAVLTAAATTLRQEPRTDFQQNPDGGAKQAGEMVVVPRTDPERRVAPPTRVPQPGAAPPVGERPASEAGPAAAAAVQPADAETPIEFVPLMPAAEQDLTGSFQIVRVQMPSASFGALRPAMGQPNAIVEADVLLGEDGRARAIRLNTSGSIYPWRLR